jgi:hypothetical protein
MPSAAKTASNAPVNRESRSRSRKLHGGDTVAKVHHQVASGLSGPSPGGMGADPDQMGPAGTVLDGDQGVDPGEKQGVHVQEVHGQHRLSLGGEELAPGRTRPARRGTDTGVMQNLPHRGGGDAMTEPNQLALYPPVSPGGIVGSHPHDHAFDRRSGWRTSGSAACGVVPFPRDQPAVSGQDRGGSD